MTPDERITYVRRFLENSGISGRDAEGGLSAVPAAMLEEANIRQMAVRNSFAETKPPFTDNAPLVAPDGTLWVERSTRLGEAALWDVFDATGKVVARVRFPAKRQLGGVGIKSPT